MNYISHLTIPEPKGFPQGRMVGRITATGSTIPIAEMKSWTIDTRKEARDLSDLLLQDYGQTEAGMQLTFRVAELQAKIGANRDNHAKIAAEAAEGFRAKAMDWFKKQLHFVEEGGAVNFRFGMPFPEDHTEDYDRVLMMLSMCTEAEIELSESQFAQYVMDDWGWKRDFLQSNANYSALAATAME